MSKSGVKKRKYKSRRARKQSNEYYAKNRRLRMETELKLAVNDIPIKTDYFVKEFTEHTAIGMMGGLRDTGEVKELKLSICEGVVTITINGRSIPVNQFATRIIITTTEGLLKPMKGITFPIQKVDLYIKNS
jgi:hypothetical protein